MPGPMISKPKIHRQMPDVKRFTSRMIAIPANRNSLEQKLREWIKQVLDYIGQNAPIEGIRPENHLTATADGIETMMYAPVMSLDATNVYAEFVWGRRPDGRWYIRHVKFSLHLSQAQLTEAERRRLKDRLLDKAESDNARHFHARQTLFPAEQYIHTWHDEIRQGSTHLKYLIEDIYERAKEEASMPENWIGPFEMGFAFLGDAGNLAVKGVKSTQKMAGIYEAAGKDAVTTGRRVITSGSERVEFAFAQGPASPQSAARGLGMMSEGEEIARTAEHLSESVERAERLGKFWEKEHKAHIVYESGKQLNDEGEEGAVFKKSRADKIADIAVDVATLIPGAGGLVKMFAGMFIEMGLANYAGIVAKIRGRIYSCFVGGFITGIALAPGSPLKHERDKKYYDLGVQKGLRLGPKVSFQYQIALLNYAMEHYTSGFWAGTTPEYHGRQASHWDYPDDWEAKWSPQLLGRSLVTMLGFKHYLIE
jgi:hypothetical protein